MLVSQIILLFIVGKMKVAQHGIKGQLALPVIVKSFKPHCLETAMMNI